ncbi:MAG: Bax inhibitor-1/YccA family protein [Parvularculales bacterium]
MADYKPRTPTHTVAGARASASPAIDEGLRAYMLGVYNHMGLGLLITALTAWFTFSVSFTGAPGALQMTEIGAVLFNSPLKWLVILAPLGMVFFLSFRVHKMSFPAARGTFYAYAALVGLSLGILFAVYTATSLTQVFLITATTFGALSLYGYTTKRDLTAWGSFLFMGLIGIILAMVVNIFMASPALQFAINAIGVLIFAGLTAYDTQKIKEIYYVGDSAAVAGRKSIMGALRLYLDFLNMFLFLLQFLGNRE